MQLDSYARGTSLLSYSDKQIFHLIESRKMVEMIHFFPHEIIKHHQYGRHFLFSLYINHYLTFKKSENKRWSLFSSSSSASAAAVKLRKCRTERKKKMKEKYIQRACNGCPIHCFIHIFVRLHFRQTHTHIHINNCLPMANNPKGRNSFSR